MKSNVRHTFRPNLEALEDRLVPMQGFSWGIVSSPDFAAVLTAAQPAAGWDIGKHVPTAAQPAPTLSSFQWGISHGNAAVLTAAQPAPALSSFSWGLVGNPDFLHTMSVGPTTVVAAFPMESVSL